MPIRGVGVAIAPQIETLGSLTVFAAVAACNIWNGDAGCGSLYDVCLSGLVIPRMSIPIVSVLTFASEPVLHGWTLERDPGSRI